MKILVHASFYARNFGDVLLWEIIVDELRKAAPTAEFLHTPIATRLRALFLRGSWREAGSREKVDLVLFAGGGYFCPPGNQVLKWHVRNYFRHRQALFHARRALKVAFVGVGFGDLGRSPLGRAVSAIDAERVPVALLRDRESLDAFLTILPGSNGVVCHDLAFSYLAKRAKKAPLGGSTLGLHVELRGRTADQMRELDEALRVVKEHHDGPVRLLTDCDTRHGRRSRAYVEERIGRTCETVIFSRDTHAFLQAIEECAAIITTKLHVGICSVALGVPTLSLPTHLKTRRFYEKINMPQCVVTHPRKDVVDFLSTPYDYIADGEILKDAANEFGDVSRAIKCALLS